MHHLPAQNRQTFGFTLIELMIAITIGGVVLALGVSRFITFNRTQGIKSAGLYVKNNLRLFQSSMSIKEENDCPVGQSITAKEVFIYLNTGRFTLTPVCTGGRLSTNQKEFFLPTGYTFRRYVNTDTYRFRLLPLEQGININQVRIGIRNTSTGYYYALCLSKGGDIKDCGYAQGGWPTCSCP